MVAPNTLTVPDMKALVTAAQDKTDSPVQQKKGELTRQLYGDKRFAKVQAMADKFKPTHTALTNHADAAAALVALNPV